MKIIKVTQELKDKVKDLFDGYEVGAIVSIRLPKRIVLIEDGVSTTYEGFDKREELQNTLGFKELPTKPILAENEVLTNGFIEVGNEFHYEIKTLPPLTLEEIEEKELEAIKQKYEFHKQNGWDAYQLFRAKIVNQIDKGIITEMQAFLIEQYLNVAYDRISSTGDWKTALFMLSQVTIPTEYSFVENYKNIALQEIQDYITNNYDN